MQGEKPLSKAESQQNINSMGPDIILLTFIDIILSLVRALGQEKQSSTLIGLDP